MSNITSYGQLAVGSIAAGDVLPIVDVDDTSMAPTGTTKKVAASDLVVAATGSVGIACAVVGLTDAATIAVNAALGNDFRVTLAGNRTLGAPSNPVDGQKIIFQVTQDATGSRTLAYASAYEFGTGLASPTLSTGANLTDLLGFVYNATKSKWLFVAFVGGFS